MTGWHRSGLTKSPAQDDLLAIAHSLRAWMHLILPGHDVPADVIVGVVVGRIGPAPTSTVRPITWQSTVLSLHPTRKGGS